ncbi:MAG TPA: hypothetical protein DCY13_25230, partial [Verrucomicrobiales bacterium]|nr:hypothetical protein [Verrucomicrobiales bacterium]
MRTTPLTIVVGWLVAMGSPCDSLAVVSALELAPDFGPPGSVIRLGGLGFVAGEQYQVRIGGISAAVQAVDDSGVDFVVPAGAATGLVELDHDQQTYTLPNLFVVTRMIDAMLPAGVVPDPALYDVGTWYGDSQPNGGAHTVEVALGATTIVAASAGEADPTLFAIATDETAGVMLNAASTAQALIFLTPGVFVQEPVEAAARLGFIQGRPETAALAALIETELAAGRDYLESTPVELQTRIALLAFITEYTPAQSTGSAATPSLMGVPRVDDFANESPGIAAGYPRDLTLEEIPILRKLESSTNGTQNTSPRGLPIRGVKIGALPNPVGLPNLPVPVPVNPLDWSALLYQLDPTDPLLDTPAKAAALMHSDNTAFDRLNPTPLDRLHVKAKPTFRLIDLTGMLEGVIYSPVADAFVSKTQLDVPADRPGLYIIRAFSGARFPLQAGLVASLPDGRTEARKAMVLNLVLAANDLVGVVAGQVDKSCLTGFVLKLERQLLTLLEREGSQEALSSDTVLLLFLEASKTYIKEYIVKCIVLDKNRKGMSGTGKVLLKQLDISAKIAAGGKLGERIMALGNFYDTLAPRGIRAWVVQSVEDTLVVVGNPWEPMIASFYPQAGYRGAKVRINGRHFSTVPEDNLVTFGLLTTDPENPPAPARAEVLRATSNSLIVRVPEQAQTGAITVAVAGQGSTASTDLPERFRTFEVYPDPVIQSIEPDPPVAGQFMRIHGENFARDFEDQTLDYLSTFDDKPLLGSRQTLLAQVPNSTAANGVKVVIEGRSSNEWPFTAVLPEVIPEGAAITITTLADNETADGDISLREAIKVATGTLGRALTSPPDPRPPGQSYETDHVFVPVGNPPPGAGSRDSIGVSVNILNGTIAVGSPLPPLGSFDSYSLPVTVDGTGVGGNGFEFDGSLKLTMQLDVLRGFGGHGVRLSGGARENTL